MRIQRRFACLVLLMVGAGPLSGCLGVESVEVAGAPGAEAMVARAPEAPNGVDPADDLAMAKKSYRERNFGLAEQAYRRAVEKSPSNAEAWLGLGATHDQLGRFDLADRDYAQVEKRAGVGFALLNNRGYSYMMRGDLKRARADFKRALALRPESDFVRNNLRELDAKASATL